MPRWSRNGKKILFYSNASGSDQLYVMDIHGSHRKMLTGGAYNNKVGTWSHDGKRIAFKSDRSGKWGIYVMNADGSTAKLVTEECEEFGTRCGQLTTARSSTQQRVAEPRGSG